MRLLLTTTCLSALAVTGASPALAETVIGTAVTTPVATATGNDDLRVSSAGSVKPASGTAVTINSNHKVTNEGIIQITGANNAIGILGQTGFTGDITNAATGQITIDETYTPTDSDSDGDIDGPFAQGSGRFAIRIAPGANYTGTIGNAGKILVEGNNSGGIVVASDLLTGSVQSSGEITVIGDNGVGIRANNVSGNVIVSKGVINVRGAGSVGVEVNGDVGGRVVIQGAVSSSGYRFTTAPADVSKLDADDLLQGGSAVAIRGNVAGGLLFDAPPKDTNPSNADEDGDGTPDAQETTASIVSLGSAPAVIVGSATGTVDLGLVSGTTAGFVNRGVISGQGVYKGVAGTGVQLGGLGNAVTVNGGILNAGTISAGAVDANATGLLVGAGTTAPLLSNSGTISATGGGTASTASTAVLIDTGASLPSLVNSGTIQAARGGADGTATAILDRSGTLTSIQNTGTIGVSGAAALGSKAVAIDLSAGSAGVSIVQGVVSGTTPAPSIVGNVLLGGGNDLLDVRDGTLLGNVSFGGGTDSLSLSGDAVATGDIDFGSGGGVLSLAGTSILRGQLLNSGGVDATVGAGTTLDATNLGAVNLNSLTVGNGATLGVTIGSASHTQYVVAGAASFGTGGRIAVTLVDVGGVAGIYTIVDAGSVSGGGDLVTTVGALPFLFDSSISTATPGEVRLTIRTKTADELGLNDSEAAILPALIDVVDADEGLAAVLLNIGDSESLSDTLQSLLPEHAGGAFENATKGVRLATKALLDPIGTDVESGRIVLSVNQVGWGSSKGIGRTSSYKLGGWGATAAAELSLGGMGVLGAGLGYFSGRDSHDGNELTSGQFEGSLYWRAGSGPLRGFARIGASTIGFDSVRRFSADVNGQAVEREAEGDWRGTTVSAAAGVGYDLRVSRRLTVRPTAVVEYLRLKEKGYAEEGGGEVFNLTVDGRSSNETAATGALAIGYELLGTGQDTNRMRVELEGGYRSILGGKLGATTARFGEDGTPFTLRPEQRDSGFVGALRLLGGGDTATLGAELNAEQQAGRVAIGGKASLRLAF